MSSRDAGVVESDGGLDSSIEAVGWATARGTAEAAARRQPRPAGGALHPLRAAPIANPIAVRATHRKGTTTVTACLPGQRRHSARNSDAPTLLAQLGVAITEPTERTLVTDDPATLPALLTLARSVEPDTTHAETAAHIGWWADRADFPASTAVVFTPDGCRTCWVTGEVPAAEAQPRTWRTWRTWLGVHDDACPGLLLPLDRLTAAAPLPLLDAIAADDAWAWAGAQSEHADAWDWRRPDNLRRAAVGLRARAGGAGW